MHGINVLSELERNGLQWSYKGSEHVEILCPFHADKTPSCHVSVKSGDFICRASSCAQKGDFVALLTRILNQTRAVVFADLCKRYNLEHDAPIDFKCIEQYHEAIWAAGPLLTALRDRCVSDEDIRLYRLGMFQNRITIPVKARSGIYVNIRSYLPGAPGTDKMKNLKGRATKLRLFPIEQMNYEKVVICGGEIKAIAAARVLNTHGYGCVAVTGGEGSWEAYLNDEFRGKEVWVMMDIDRAGDIAAALVCRHVARHAIKTYIVELGKYLDIDTRPKGDVNDFLAARGDLLSVIEAAPEWEAATRYSLDNEIYVVELQDTITASKATKRVSTTGMVSAIQDKAYAVPKCVRVRCSRTEDFCAVCPVSMNSEEDVYTIDPEAVTLLKMVDKSLFKVREALMEDIGIPTRCPSAEFDATEYFSVRDVQVTPALDISSRNHASLDVRALCVADRLEANEHYKFVGRVHPDPYTQSMTLMLSSIETAQDALSTYQCEYDVLAVFKPDEWTLDSLESKLAELYTDLSSHVTKIVERQDMHLLVDLAYHSPLLIDFCGNDNTRGWVEVLIIGDSSQGKTETAIKLQEFYNLGERVVCKNTTAAGLVGGLQQKNGHWYTTWGRLPMNDRRLIILDELKGTPPEVFAALTDVRSSGVAAIEKIQQKRTNARCRIVAISNSLSGNKMDTFSYGLLAIRELIPGLEDIRRFDMCMVVADGEVDARVINYASRLRGDPVYSSKQCRDLVLWAWTCDKAIFDSDAEEHILDESAKLCDEYTEAMPFLDRGSTRLKVARLSAALAARTFSKDENTDRVLVRKCHVQYIIKFIRRVYNNKVFGYDKYSETKQVKQLRRPKFLTELINTHSNGKYGLLMMEHVTVRNITEYLNVDNDTGRSLLSTLLACNAIEPTKKQGMYVKTAQFIELLKSLKDIDTPEFISNDEM